MHLCLMKLIAEEEDDDDSLLPLPSIKRAIVRRGIKAEDHDDHYDQAHTKRERR